MKKNLLYLLIISLTIISLKGQNGGYALQFDGTDDFISIADNASIDFTSGNSYTLEAWIYADVLTAANTGRAVLSKWNSSDDSYFIRVSPDGSLVFDNLYTVPGVITTNKWYHIACVYKTAPDAYRKVFVNGVEKSLSGSVISVNDGNSEPLKIGRHNSFANDWDGKIDEVRIWNVARTVEEIRAAMNKELNGNETGLAAYYKMSDGSGTTLTDNQTSGSNTGTISGATWKTSGSLAGSRQALDFDGTDEHLSIPHNASLNMGTGNFTYEFWVKKDVSGVRYDIISKEATNENNDLSILISESNQAVIYTKGTTTTHSVTSISTVPINVWTHIAGVRDGNTLRVYINGILDNSSTGTAQDITNTNVMLLGANFTNNLSPTGYLNGQLDEVRIWNTARTESEIRESMMRNLIGNETNLVAYYRFDHYNGITLYDITVNGNNGTLTNMETADWVSSTAFNLWIGSESSAWSTVSNWSSGSVPSATDNVGLYKWDLGSETTISGTPTVNHILFSSTSSPTLSSILNVNGNLILENDLDLNGQNINLGSPYGTGYLVEGNHRLFGATGTINIENSWVTPTNLNAGGLGLVLTSTNSISRFITRGHTEQTSNVNKSILRYYNLFEGAKSIAKGIRNPNKENLAATTVDIVFHYNESELNGLNENTLALFMSTDGGTTWTQQGGLVNTTDNTVSLSGADILQSSRWTLGSTTSPLPVELTSFTANADENKVLLNWETASEVNNYGFEIQKQEVRSKKLEEGWEKVGFVEGHGNSNSPKEYSFIDQEYDQDQEIIRYRLKQIDFDGKFEYSEVVEVEVNVLPTEFSLSQNYPNPFNPSTSIEYTVPSNEYVNLKVYDVLGNEVAVLVNGAKEAGSYKVSFDASSLSSGVYFYKIQAGSFNQVRKMMLVK